MTTDRRHKRTSREIGLDIESLGERIAPAVYHHGIVHLNLVVEHQKPNHELSLKEHRHEKTKAFEKLGHQKLNKFEYKTSNNVGATLKLSSTVSVSSSQPTTFGTSHGASGGTLVPSNTVVLPTSKPTIVATSLSVNSSPVISSSNPNMPLELIGPPIRPNATSSSDSSAGTSTNNSPVVSSSNPNMPLELIGPPIRPNATSSSDSSAGTSGGSSAGTSTGSSADNSASGTSVIWSSNPDMPLELIGPPIRPNATN